MLVYHPCSLWYLSIDWCPGQLVWDLVFFWHQACAVNHASSCKTPVSSKIVSTKERVKNECQSRIKYEIENLPLPHGMGGGHFFTMSYSVRLKKEMWSSTYRFFIKNYGTSLRKASWDWKRSKICPSSCSATIWGTSKTSLESWRHDRRRVCTLHRLIASKLDFPRASWYIYVLPF